MQLPESLFGAGMLKFITRSLENYEAALKPRDANDKVPSKGVALPKYVTALNR